MFSDLSRKGFVLGMAVLAPVCFMLFVLPARAVVNSTSFPATKDAEIRQDREARNYGARADMKVWSQAAKKNGPGRNRRSVIEFDISSIPPGATIEAADLRIYLKNKPNNQRTHNTHRLLQGWREGSGDDIDNDPAVDGITWVERRFGDNVWSGVDPDWTSIGGHYQTTPTASALTLGAAGWMIWDVMADVSAWYSGVSSNYGWIIRDGAEDAAKQESVRFLSKEDPDPALAPELVVTYLRAATTVSTSTVPVAWYGSIDLDFTNNAGAGGDQVNRVAFVIPGAWSRIPTAAVDYSITAPGGKIWSVAGVPASAGGPQTVIVSAAGGTDDLADGESLRVTFNVNAPWLLGASDWFFAARGSAGGTHTPSNWTILTTTGSLAFLPGGDESLADLTLSGSDSTATGTLGTLNIRDSRGTAGGWSVVAAASDFVHNTDPSATIPAARLVVPTAPGVTVVAGSGPPATTAGGLSGAGLEVMRASAGTGAGEFDITPALELGVPADALSGSYSSTITATLVGGL